MSSAPFCIICIFYNIYNSYYIPTAIANQYSQAAQSQYTYSTSQIFIAGIFFCTFLNFFLIFLKKHPLKNRIFLYIVRLQKNILKKISEKPQKHPDKTPVFLHMVRDVKKQIL